MNIMQTRDFEKDTYLQQLNISVDTKEMVQIKARLLDPPQIRFRQGQSQTEAIESVNVGKWKIRGNRFYQAPEIRNWGLIYYGKYINDRMKQTVTSFANQLPDVRLDYRQNFEIISHLILF